MATYHGSCHCGAIEFRYETERAPRDWSIRACQCSFCRRHGARCTSDNDGRASIVVNRTGDVEWYRFGLRTADMLVCPDCGVYVGAVIATDKGRFATLNCNALDESPPGMPAATPVNYDSESASGRIARRERAWTPVEPGRRGGFGR